jgi:putative redox protein
VGEEKPVGEETIGKGETRMPPGDQRAVRLTWSGAGLRFAGAGTDPVTPAIVIDGDGAAGPSPMIALLLAAAGCAGADVVSILAKMRVALQQCEIEITGARRATHPRRYTALRLRFTLAGDGLDRAKAERAAELSLRTYCSVIHSLAPDIVVQHEVVLA